MANSPAQPKLRRFGIYVLILLAFGLLSTVTWVLITDEVPFTEVDVFPEPVVVNLEQQPRFIFPEKLRTNDLSLNRFIDRFCRVCSTAKYTEFKLMLSRRAEFNPRQFESMFHALKQARILAVEPLPPLAETGGKVYLLKAEYDLEDWVTKPQKKGNVTRLAILEEDDDWRIGPIPRESAAKLEEYQASVEAGPHDAMTEQSDWRIPRPAANKPVRIDE